MKCNESGRQTTPTAHVKTEDSVIIEVSLSVLVYRKAAIDDLDDLYQQIDCCVLSRASQVLAAAQSVVVITTGEDRCVLVPMQHAAVQCSFDWRFHDGFRDAVEGPTLDLKSVDVVVVISTAPHHPYNTLAAWLARDVGAHVIGITDSPESPVGCLARDALIVPVPGRGLFKSYIGATALVEMLVLMAAGRRGAQAAADAEGSAIAGTVPEANGSYPSGVMR